MKTLLRSKLVIATAVVTTLGAITFACKDFLEQPPQGTVDEVTLSTKFGVEGSLVAAYRSLDCSNSSAGSWGCAASNWVWGSVPSGDAYKGSDLGDQQPINSIENFTWGVAAADGYINHKWAQMYEGVARANATLRLLDKILVEKPQELSAADADGIRGEAIFLRAHYHFEAYRMWGSNADGGVGGIPYYRQTDLDPRKTNVGTDALAEILTDLDSARILLRTCCVSPRGGDKGRASFWTAQAYKGRVQVYAAALNPAMWAAARQTLDSVRVNGPYALEPSFDRVWTSRPAFRNGPETIFAFQASSRDGEPDGWNANWGERLNFPHGATSRSTCCGFHQPTFNLVNFFRVDATGLPIAMTDPAWNNPAPEPDATMPPSDTAQTNTWRGLNFHAGRTDAIDPRLDWTVGRDNVPYKDWGVHRRGWIRDAAYSGPYSPKKNAHEIADTAVSEGNAGWTASQTNDMPIHLFRYADMLLLLAEAEVEAGSLVNALTIVNQIRARAGQTAQGCAADSTVTNRYPTCAGNSTLAEPMIQGAVYDSLVTPWARYRVGQYTAFADQATARRAVRYERRLELALEGQRFFDLRRWGGADTVIANYRSAEAPRVPHVGLGGTMTLPKYARYPIPSVQIELSRVGTEDRLQQNPNW